MIVITGTVRIPTGSLSRVRPIMQVMIEGSRAEEGCIHYSYAEDVLEPGLIWVSESWRDAEALAAHGASPHMAEWRASWSALGIHDRNLTVYDVSAARPL
jgi:quinol monooxygenase YgiN